MENVYEKYNVKEVINASGKMTILGGSRVNEDILKQMNIGASSFFEVKDLLDKTGDYIARLLGVEAAYIVNSASGGIAQSVASLVSQGDLKHTLHLQSSTLEKRNIIIPKGHNVDYGTTIETPITMGGGKVVEAGYANVCKIEHVEALIDEYTVALMYVKSHHCVQKGMQSIKEYVDLAKKYQLPVIIDAAAEEDLTKYYHMGGDIVIYSGTKALEGPTSGLIVGKKEYVEGVKKQSVGIGRVMKVGKENVLGLVQAIDNYCQRKPQTLEQQSQRLEEFNAKLNAQEGVKARCVQDGAGRAIIRSEVSFDEHVLHINALSIAKLLKEGDLRIYTRDYRANEGKIEIDIRDVSDNELTLILEKIFKIIGEEDE